MPLPKSTKRRKPDLTQEDDTPKKKKKMNSEPEENSKENDPPKVKKEKKKKKLVKEEDESGVVSDLSAEFPEAVSPTLPNEREKKKRTKAGKGEKITENSTPVSTSQDPPAKKKSKKLFCVLK